MEEPNDMSADYAQKPNASSHQQQQEMMMLSPKFGGESPMGSEERGGSGKKGLGVLGNLLHGGPK